MNNNSNKQENMTDYCDIRLSLFRDVKTVSCPKCLEGGDNDFFYTLQSLLYICNL